MKFYIKAVFLFLLIHLPLSLSANQQQALIDDSETEAADETANNKGFKASVYKLIQPVSAEPYWSIQTSLWTKHFNPKPEHNNRQKLIGIERNRDDSYLWGGATFLNSFKQRTYYAYVGKQFDFGQTPFYGKLTAGLLHGYKGEYRDKIPFNRYKIAPAILPSLGVKYKRVHLEAIMAGTAAVMVNAGVKL